MSIGEWIWSIALLKMTGEGKNKGPSLGWPLDKLKKVKYLWKTLENCSWKFCEILKLFLKL